MRVMYFHLHYCKCLGIQQGGNTSLLPSTTMYLDSGGKDENGVVTTSDQRSSMKTHQLLSGLIDDVGGINKEL